MFKFCSLISFDICIIHETITKIKIMNITITKVFMCPCLIPPFLLLAPHIPHIQATADLFLTSQISLHGIIQYIPFSCTTSFTQHNYHNVVLTFVYPFIFWWLFPVWGYYKLSCYKHLFTSFHMNISCHFLG